MSWNHDHSTVIMIKSNCKHKCFTKRWVDTWRFVIPQSHGALNLCTVSLRNYAECMLNSSCYTGRGVGLILLALLMWLWLKINHPNKGVGVLWASQRRLVSSFLGCSPGYIITWCNPQKITIPALLRWSLEYTGNQLFSAYFGKQQYCSARVSNQSVEQVSPTRASHKSVSQEWLVLMAFFCDVLVIPPPN